ncbi:restriction endonuclease subunit S [Clostridium perfringens]|nr:restriction endonuclease subunit S [Clostridium perfringens]
MNSKNDMWRKCKLKDIMEFNPKESIKKKNIAKKVAMDKLEPFTRKVSGYVETEFTSGTKFRNGDILLARITPCLENGKTAQVDILDENEIGFGSTEYIVLREKLGITFNDYIYYLAISPEFRNMAIKSMTGSSGRQRVQKDVLEESEIILPPLKEQKAIAKILSDLDEKIEVNNKINKNLEEMAQAIFKQWFVDFEFPNEEGKPYKSSGGEMVESEFGMIPKGWKISKIGEVVKIIRGASPRPIQNYLASKGMPWLKISDATSSSSRYIYSTKEFIIEEGISKSRKVEKGTLVLSNSATPGIAKIMAIEACVHDGWLIFNEYKNINKEYIYYYLSREREKILLMSNGSVFRNLKTDILKNYPIIIPNSKILDSITETFTIIGENINKNSLEIETLNKIRDTLLPKLISGEIRVPLENSEN